jgi:hypothetical protein
MILFKLNQVTIKLWETIENISRKDVYKLWVLTVLNDPFDVQVRNVWTVEKPIENPFQKRCDQLSVLLTSSNSPLWSLGEYPLNYQNRLKTFPEQMWQTLSTTNILKWSFWSLGKQPSNCQNQLKTFPE